MTTETRPAWAPILLIVYAGAGFVLSIGMGVAFGVLALTDYIQGDMQAGFFGIWSSVAFGVIGVAGLPAIALGARSVWFKVAGGLRAPARVWLVAFAAYPLGLALGYVIYVRQVGSPVFGTFAQILALGGPIVAMAVLVQRSGQAMSALRAWGHFLLGLWLVPTLAFVVELVLLILGIFILLGGLLLGPEGQQLFGQLQGPPGKLFTQPPPELVTQAISEPWVIFLAVLFISFIIPVVEEGLKSITIWPMLSRAPDPSQAFIGGALGGLGFAMVEGMFLTQPDSTWFLTAFIRGGASMMHALAAGITAWGLAEAVVRRKYGRLPLAYLTAISLHGLWNLSAVSLGVAQLSSEVGLPAIGPQMESLFTLAGATLLGVLSLMALIGVPIIARRLSHPRPSADPGAATRSLPTD